VNWNNPVMRLLIGVVAVALAIRIVWLLIQPVLPALAVALVTFTIFRVVSWWRDERW
jgi:hypothetical protein